MLGHLWGPFLLPKKPRNAQKRAHLDKYERNWRYKKMRSFFALLRADLLFWAISGARFCFEKGLKCPKMPKKGQTWCFQPPFTLTKHTKQSNDKHERNWRYEKMRSFFAVLRADLLFWAISEAHFCFQKGLEMPKKGQTWCFQPPFTLRKHTKKSKGKHERNRRYNKTRSFFRSVTS